MADSDESPDARYSIRVASRLTGLSADTLRMWERRYGFPKPSRNGSQVRFYSDADIERLGLVFRALKAGFRAGEVIHRETPELRDLLASSTAGPAQVSVVRESPTVDALIEALRADDPSAVQSGLRRAVATLGPRQFITDVASGLVERVGEEWAQGRLGVRHEHLLSEALSTQLRLLLSAYDNAGAPVVLLTAVSREQHSLGLEMAALYLALEGACPRLLGVDTPPDQIVEAASALGARVIGLSISTAADTEVVSEQVRWILTELPPGVELWLGGKTAGRLGLSDGRLFYTPTWPDVDRELARVRGRNSAVSAA
ncbi:MAG TPA: MerR family transcriptional regulator [Polyangiaceae bacterium]|nr:MerR family transcriptional regulator [Polyangiaceae bacterium]